MRLHRLPWLAAGLLVSVAGCQAAPSQPTVAPAATSAPVASPAPTRAPSPAVASPGPRAASPGPSVAPASPSPVRSPSPVAAASPPSVTASRVDILNSANAAFQRGDTANAAGLYERALNTPPSSQESPEARAAIDDFAHFRAMLSLLISGHEDDARQQLDELQARDPNAPLARLGSQLWDQYGMTAQVRGACTQLQPLVASQAGQVLAALTSAGVNVDAASLCTVP